MSNMGQSPSLRISLSYPNISLVPLTCPADLQSGRRNAAHGTRPVVFLAKSSHSGLGRVSTFWKRSSLLAGRIGIFPTCRTGTGLSILATGTARRRRDPVGIPVTIFATRTIAPSMSVSTPRKLVEMSSRLDLRLGLETRLENGFENTLSMGQSVGSSGVENGELEPKLMYRFNHAVFHI